MDEMKPYWTVVIPYSETPTLWHPTSPVGPFSTLTRGSFKDEDKAHAWAKGHLNGQPYSTRLIDPSVN
jgi:hypothetical protein